MLNKADYNVTAQDRLQYAQYELLKELVDLLSGEYIPEETQKKIEKSQDNNEIIQSLKQDTLFDLETLEPKVKPKVGGEVKNDKSRNSKGRKTANK